MRERTESLTQKSRRCPTGRPRPAAGSFRSRAPTFSAVQGAPQFARAAAEDLRGLDLARRPADRPPAALPGRTSGSSRRSRRSRKKASSRPRPGSRAAAARWACRSSSRRQGRSCSPAALSPRRSGRCPRPWRCSRCSRAARRRWSRQPWTTWRRSRWRASCAASCSSGSSTRRTSSLTRASAARPLRSARTRSPARSTPRRSSRPWWRCCRATSTAPGTTSRAPAPA